MISKLLVLLSVQCFFSTTVLSQDAFIETREVSIGNNHACALTAAGVKCWGEAEQSTLKAPLELVTGPRSLATGNRFSCMIIEEGIRCWGEIPESSKTDVLFEHKDLNQPKLLAVGHNHACAVSAENKIKCWGENLFGETSPPDGLGNITEISAGMNNTCAISDGAVRCWGLNNTGSLDVPEGLKNPRNLTSGWWHHCVATDDGIKCWGNPYSKYVVPEEVRMLNQFSSGDFYNCAATPEAVKCWDQKGKIKIVEESAGATKVAVGSSVGCAISPDRGLFCWKLYGENAYKHMMSYVPSGGVKNIKHVAAGYNSTCVYGDDNKMKCWGANPYGALTVPEILPGPISRISHGSKRTCAIRHSQLSCWGDTDKYFDIPENIGNISYVAVGGYHVCAASPDKARCWGENDGGVFEVPRSVTNISKLASGNFHACAEANYNVVCWGGKTYVSGVNPPEKISYPRALCAGSTFSCAITVDGDVKCWGRKEVPAEPPPSEDNPPSFTESNFAENFNSTPSSVTNATELSCGNAHACAIYENKVKCWDTDGTNLKVPENLSNPRQLSAGANHTCVLTDEGLRCWGGMLNMEMPDYSLKK